MDLLLQRVVDGLSDGAIFGIFALAVVLVYRSTGIINFAQGEMGMLCAFIAWYLADESGLHLPLLLAIAGGVAAGFVLGAGIERVVMRPFLGGDPLVAAFATMGLFLVINAAAAGIFGTKTRRLESPFPEGTAALGGVRVDYQTLGQLAVIAVISVLLWALFTRTRLGVTLRAASMAPESSQLLGINVPLNLTIGWGLAAALGALAAILVAPALYLSTSMMTNVLLYGFAAAVVGGLDSTIGAVVGGLLIGLSQSLIGGYVPFIGTQLQLLSALGVVLLVLLVRPQGLFGRLRTDRV